MVGGSVERLVEALEGAGAPPKLLRQALDGFYHDFRSPLPFPCMQLVDDLVEAGLPVLAGRARRGEFDADREEADEWAASVEGREAFRELLGGVAAARPTSPPVARWYMDEDVVVACADLVGRSGGSGFEVGHDEPSGERPRWYAQAVFPTGRKIVAEGHSSPTVAAETLAVRLLTDARCRCGRLVAFADDAAGRCCWVRVGRRWRPGCE